GEWLTVRDCQIEKRGNFFRFPSPAVQPRTTSDTIAELDQTLREAVRRQLVADVPVAAFLSGGVDSSVVVAFARQESEAPLDCFTIRLADSDSEYDGMVTDLPYARQVAQHLGVTLHEVEVDNVR